MDIRFLIPTLVFAVGLYFLIILCTRRGKMGGGATLSDSFGSLMLALAGTLGVGNIFGVATAIIIGGAGSVFWLLVSSVFAAVIKYAEVSVASSYNSSDGMIGVIKKSFSRIGIPLAKLYALLSLLLAFVMGFALQGGSVVQSARAAFGTPELLSILAVALIMYNTVGGSGRKIKSFTAIVIPLTTIVYIIMAIMIIVYNISELPRVINAVFRDAFSADGCVGGVVGFITSSKIREGFSSGILSNEAGAGTSSFAHTSGEYAAPFCGALEVLFDTVVLCMLSALAILTAVPDIGAYESGVKLMLDAIYSTLGGGGIGALLFAISSFAVCTAVCWYYYGRVCIRELFGSWGSWIYLAASLVSIAIGGFVSTDLLAVASHVLLLGLSLISLLTLIKNSGRLTGPPEEINIKANGFSKEAHRQAKKASQAQSQAQTRSFSHK